MHHTGFNAAHAHAHAHAHALALALAIAAAPGPALSTFAAADETSATRFAAESATTSPGVGDAAATSPAFGSGATSPAADPAADPAAASPASVTFADGRTIIVATPLAARWSAASAPSVEPSTLPGEPAASGEPSTPPGEIGASAEPGAHPAPRAVRLRYPALDREIDAQVGKEAIVQLADGADPDALLPALGLQAVQSLLPARGLWLVRSTTDEDGLAVAARLAGTVSPAGPLLRATPDLAFRARPLGGFDGPPDDPRFGGQWYLDRIDILDAWALEAGSPEVTIVVVDNGCDAAHPELTGKLDPGLDVVDVDDDPSPHPTEPGNEHGTACAGLAAATTRNGEGIAGTCPGCRLRCVRMLGPEGQYVPTSASVEAFQLALDTNAAVVSNSWGYVDAVPVPASLADAIAEVHASGRSGRGALVLFAAGNDGREVGDEELLAVPGVIGIGATTTYDEATSYTNFGASVDLSTPAGTLATDISGAGGADPGDYTSRFGGTSSACPVAAGVAGLLVSAAPEATAAELEAALLETARPAPYAQPDADGHDLTYGYGIIDPAAALRRVLGLPDPEPEPVDGGTCAEACDGGTCEDGCDDGSSEPDGGEGAGGGGPAGGCDCAQGGGAGGALPWALVALALSGRRRARSRDKG